MSNVTMGTNYERSKTRLARMGVKIEPLDPEFNTKTLKQQKQVVRYMLSNKGGFTINDLSMDELAVVHLCWEFRVSHAIGFVLGFLGEAMRVFLHAVVFVFCIGAIAFGVFLVLAGIFGW